MQEIKCQTCGAECAAGTSFCRQCGAPINSDSTQAVSEQTTALLGQSEIVATQRLESRATGGSDHGRLPQPADDGSAASVPEKSASRRGILIGALVIVVIGVICAALIGLRHKRETTGDLIYPGAKTVVDMTGESGGRAIHLETSDSFKTVEEWYQKALKPQKTMRLTSASVVLKNDKTTATIAADSTKTNILIKVAP